MSEMMKRAAAAVEETAKVDMHFDIVNPEEVALAVVRTLRKPNDQMRAAAMAHWGSDAAASPATAESRCETFTAMIDALISEQG